MFKLKQIYSNCMLLVIIALILSIMCCKQYDSKDLVLVTERQECVIKYFKHVTGEVFPQTIAIDIPIDGPQALMDSITRFYNEKLYNFFDNGETYHFPYEKMFSTDFKQLTEHYRKAYADFIPSDSTSEHEFATDCLELNIVAQTSKYVTYEVNSIFYGEGVENAKEWITFVKSDGHILSEVIKNSEMLRFYREQPNLRSDAIWENLFNHSSEEDSLNDIVCSVGLLKDSIAHQYIYAPGIFENFKYPLDRIAPYLTKETQDLIR